MVGYDERPVQLGRLFIAVMQEGIEHQAARIPHRPPGVGNNEQRPDLSSFPSPAGDFDCEHGDRFEHPRIDAPLFIADVF